jgi:peroxiredoxin
MLAGVALSAMVGVGCAPAPVTPMGDSATPMGDAAAPQADSGESCARPALNNTCTMEGCDFAQLQLPYCGESGGTFDFYNTNFCSNQVTLVVISAGWCVPCQQEAQQMQAEIIEPYAGRVRVVTVYGQNTSRVPPTSAECMVWKNRYSLDSHMVYDPMGLTQRYFPNMAFPANMIIDRDGVIRHRVYGTSRGLQSLKDQIDGLLQ